MARVRLDPAVPDRASLDNEIARLRGLDVGELRARWHTVFRRRAPPHLPRHLLFRILAYRLQADRLGELDPDCRRLLDRIGSGSSDGISRLVAYRWLRVPLQLMIGQHAPAVTELLARKLAAAMNPGALRIVAGAGHMGPTSHSNVVAKMIIEHIAASEPSAPWYGTLLTQQAA